MCSKSGQDSRILQLHKNNNTKVLSYINLMWSRETNEVFYSEAEPSLFALPWDLGGGQGKAETTKHLLLL